MTVADGIYNVCIHVGSKLIEKILLNISPDWLNRVVGKRSTRHREVGGGETARFRDVASVLEEKEHYTVNSGFFLSM